MGLRRWLEERKAKKEAQRRLNATVITTAAIKSLDIPLKAPVEDTFSATGAFAIVKKTVDGATEAKRTARGAAQRIMGMLDKDKK